MGHSTGTALFDAETEKRPHGDQRRDSRISGSLGVSSNASDNSGFYGIQMTDSSEDADFCRNITRIKRDGTKLPYSNDYHFFNFNRMYDASARDITLKFLFEQSEYNTLLEGFSGTLTITALD